MIEPLYCRTPTRCGACSLLRTTMGIAKILKKYIHNLFGEVHGVLYHAGLAIIDRQRQSSLALHKSYNLPNVYTQFEFKDVLKMLSTLSRAIKLPRAVVQRRYVSTTLSRRSDALFVVGSLGISIFWTTLM